MKASSLQAPKLRALAAAAFLLALDAGSALAKMVWSPPEPEPSSKAALWVAVAGLAVGAAAAAWAAMEWRERFGKKR